MNVIELPMGGRIVGPVTVRHGWQIQWPPELQAFVVGPDCTAEDLQELLERRRLIQELIDSGQPSMPVGGGTLILDLPNNVAWLETIAEEITAFS